MTSHSAVTPNYWCTWCTQSAYLPQARKALTPLFPGDQGQPGVRDSLNEEVIFGKMRTLSLRASRKGRLFAQDLAGGAVHDITDAVRFADGRVVLPGEVLAAIGRESDSDESLPGALVWMERGMR